MISPLKIVVTLFKFCLWIGVAGGIADMTISMARKAADAHGLVSLGALNRQLFGSKRL